MFSGIEVRIYYSTRHVAEKSPQSDLRPDTKTALNTGKACSGQHSAVVLKLVKLSAA